MGNVLAQAPASLSSDLKNGLGKKRGNPGPLEDLHKRCKDIYPITFEGARITISKGLSSHFQICHNLAMSNSQPSGYRFQSTFVGTNMMGPGEAYPIFMGDINSSGNLNANFLHQLNDFTKFKLQASFEDGRSMGQFTTEFKSTDSTTSVVFINPNPVTMSGVGVVQYLQSVTPTLDLGAEIAVQRSPSMPIGGLAALSIQGRIKAPDDSYVLSGVLSTSKISACYYRKGSENVSFGVDVETDFRESSSVGTFGYQYEMPKANITFKGMVDSNLTVSGFLEKKLQPLPFTFVLSGKATQGKRAEYQFGVGLMVG